MSITARHKRPGAFRQLVTSMETTPPEKRDKIMQAIAGEDAEMALHLQRSIFAFSEFVGVHDLAVAEIVAEFTKEMRTVALALYKSKDETLVTKFTKNMTAAQMHAFKEQTEELKEVKVREQIAAQFRIVAKARELEHNARFILKRLSGNYPS